VGLYERQLGATGKIPTAALMSLLNEFGRGRRTAAETQTLLGEVSGVPFTATEVQELTDLVATISGGGAAKLARSQEIYDVFQNAEFNLTFYNTPPLLRAILQVPTR
jgi:hypothetical protein